MFQSLQTRNSTNLNDYNNVGYLLVIRLFEVVEEFYDSFEDLFKNDYTKGGTSDYLH